jgi:hypothetical protein
MVEPTDHFRKSVPSSGYFALLVGPRWLALLDERLHALLLVRLLGQQMITSGL